MIEETCSNSFSSNALTGSPNPARLILAGGACSVISPTYLELKMPIFKKTDDIDTQDTTPEPKISTAPPARPTTVSVIGPTMEFKGELSADEDLIIEGLVQGTITHHNKHLTVGKKGRVKADIHASSVLVLGQLVGDIQSEGTVTLSKGADVVGNIVCGRITMEDGARFKGSIDMEEPRKVSVVPKKPEQTETVSQEKLRRVRSKARNAS